MKERLLLGLAAWVILLLPHVYSMYSATYHQFAESPAVAVAGGLVAPLILVGVAALTTMCLRSLFLWRAFAAFMMLHAIQWITAILVPAFRSSIELRLGFAAAAILIILLCLHYFSSYGWTRLARIASAAAIAWILILPLGARLKAGVHAEPSTALSVSRILDHRPPAVAIVILDEAAPESIPALRAAMSGMHGQTLRVGTSTAAGPATVYAIPSMLTTSRHDGVIPCGETRLCGTVSFNMKNLRAEQADTDLVGAYHPYCAIQGLRSCWTMQTSNSDAPGDNQVLWKAIARRLPLVRDLFDVELNEVVAFRHARKEVAEHAHDAPFWRHGGTLYIHHLLPHPMVWTTRDGHRHDLAREYKENIHRTALFLQDINERLQRRFGPDYALIVTSDHSLRTSWWCSKPFFDSPDCLQNNPPNHHQVPFLVLAPTTIQVQLPATNVGIFTPRPDAG